MSPARILVVDDNLTNLKLAVDVLEFEGYEVLRAQNAEEAQALVKRSPPNLILMIGCLAPPLTVFFDCCLAGVAHAQTPARLARAARDTKAAIASGYPAAPDSLGRIHD